MTLTEMTLQSAREMLGGERRGWRGYAAFVGPAVVASIAYVDPGNFATNVQAGAKYGYGLLWVVLFANLVAMLFQALSAKLGIVTGRNLAELCRRNLPPPIVLAMWVVSEVAAMATDLAELVGGSLGFSLLLSVPLLTGMLITAILVYTILMFDMRGFRPAELIIGGCVGSIALCYVLELFIVPVDWGAAAFHSVVPQITGSDELLLAVGIIGATVMPHAIFLHSGLTQARIPPRSDIEKRRIIGISNGEVVLALALAGAINMAM
jgi:manganese transport protein